jgi:site-specific recombinase XerD
MVVEPIRDIKKIKKMKAYLLKHNERDYLMFVLGINSGLRISDLLHLNVTDVAGKDSIVVREKKTGKTKQFALSDTCKKAIAEYLEHTDVTEGALFASRKGGEAITRMQAWRVINEAAQAAGVTENVGTHTMRKTFGYHALRQGVDIAYLMQCFNHSSAAITKRYIGITQDELNDKVYLNMNL